MKKSFLANPFLIISPNNGSIVSGMKLVRPPVSFSIYYEFLSISVSSNKSIIPIILNNNIVAIETGEDHTFLLRRITTII